jgi:hypothetical protein
MLIGILAGLTAAAIISMLVVLIISLVIIGGVIYVAGRVVVGGKATFGSSVTIALLGIIIGTIVSLVIPIIGWFVALLVWLYLIKRFFDTGWLAAFGVAIVSIIVWVIMWIILAVIIGISLFAFI